MLREQGVRVFFIGYDVLPKTHPQYFRPYSRLIYDRWFEAALRADGILFISASAEREFTRLMDDARGAQDFFPRTGHFSLACEVPVFAQRAATGRKTLQNRKSFAFLMVGTLEPRKGHQAVLEAFERLWEKGYGHTLTMVGRAGWLTEKLLKRIGQHPQLGSHLFFLDTADDDQLWREYITADALIANSEAEGYGLPLIEAAAVGLPILARRIESFVEIAGDHAFYLDSGESENIVDSIIEWCSMASAGTNPDSRAIRVNNWTKAAEEVLAFVGLDGSGAR
jgi:glycosyltransferase involved in cell wall biosynthesis